MKMKIKQLSRFVLACSLLLTAVSCTDEVVTNNDNGGNDPTIPEGLQALTLKVGGVSGGSVTKAGTIAKPEEIEVNDMTIYVFKYDPTIGDDDTDDANYTLYDYWTYMKTAITGYTANSRDLHTFTLGGSGQFRTATIYLPKDAGKVKCLVTTGIGVICTPDGTKAYVNLAEQMLLSGHRLDLTDSNNPTISEYRYVPYPGNISPLTLDKLKKATWRELKEMNMPKNADDTNGSTIPTDYQKTPLSMMGESAMLDIDAQSGNSSQIEATLKRHVSRLDIINGNSLYITKLEIINLPFATNFMPAVDGMEATTQLTLGRSKKPQAGDEPVDSYTLHAIYDSPSRVMENLTAYVYPNLPYNTTETAKNTPFFRVSIGGPNPDSPTTVYILPLRIKNEDGTYTPVNFRSNHRYTLVLNKLGDNILDYNIVIEDWQAGADFNVNLGQEVTENQFNYLPAFLSHTEDPGWNQTIMEGEKAYCYLTDNNPATGTWKFRTAPTLYNGRNKDAQFNILRSASQGGIGTPVKATDYSISETGLGSNPTGFLHTVAYTSTNYSKPQYSTYWYTVQNPYNPRKSTRAKVEYVLHPSNENKDLYAFEEALFATAETNALPATPSGPIMADFQADTYYTHWPEKGAEFASNAVGKVSKEIATLILPFDITGTLQDGTTGIDLAAKGFKKFTYNGANYTIASNGNAETPCQILQTITGLKMWERIKGDDGAYYIRILAVPLTNTFNSFEAMRSAIRNVENGYDRYHSYIVRHFREGNYWHKYPKSDSYTLYSFKSDTFGKEITEAGSTGYIRFEHEVPNP